MLKKYFLTNLQGFGLHIAGGILSALLAANFLFLIGSSLFLQVMMTTVISQTSSNFSQIRPRTAELAALERLKKIPIYL